MFIKILFTQKSGQAVVPPRDNGYEVTQDSKLPQTCP